MEQISLMLYKYKDFIYFILGALISLIGSYITYVHSIRGSKLAYYSVNDKIFSKEKIFLGDKSIYLDKEKINNLVRTKVYFWNNGNKIVRKEDLVEENPLRIELTGNSKIYSADIVTNTEKTNGFKIKDVKEKNVVLQFNFLEPGDGVRIEILHDSEKSIAVMEGKVIGVKKGIENSKTLLKRKRDKFLDKLQEIFIFFCAWSISLLATTLFVLLYAKFKKDIFMYIVIILYPILPTIIFPIMNKGISKSKDYPSKLDD